MSVEETLVRLKAAPADMPLQEAILEDMEKRPEAYAEEFELFDSRTSVAEVIKFLRFATDHEVTCKSESRISELFGYIFTVKGQLSEDALHASMESYFANSPESKTNVDYKKRALIDALSRISKGIKPGFADVADFGQLQAAAHIGGTDQDEKLEAAAD